MSILGVPPGDTDADRFSVITTLSNLDLHKKDSRQTKREWMCLPSRCTGYSRSIQIIQPVDICSVVVFTGECTLVEKTMEYETVCVCVCVYEREIK